MTEENARGLRSEVDAALKSARLWSAIMLTGVIITIPFIPYFAPNTGFTVSGFDRNLLEIDQRPDLVSTSNNGLSMNITSNSEPFVTLATIASSFIFNINVQILFQQGNVTPVQISLWEPTSSNSLGVAFIPSQNQTYLVITSGGISSQPVELGLKYSVGRIYKLAFDYQKGSSVAVELSDNISTVSKQIVNASILRDTYVDISLFGISYGGTSQVAYSGNRLDIPFQYYWSYRSTGWMLPYAYLAVLGGISAIYGRGFLRNLRRVKSRLVQEAHGLRRSLSDKRTVLSILFVSTLVQVPLIFSGSHPYDMFTLRVYAYSAGSYGVKYLYDLASIVPSGHLSPTGSPSIIPSLHAYPPLPAYLWILFGSLPQVASPRLGSPLFEVMVKLTWILFSGLCGLIIYDLTRRTGNGEKKALLLMTAYVLNPAVILVASAAGQFDSLVALFLVAAIYMYQRDKAASTWLFLGLAILTKQTALVPSTFLGIAALRKFGWARNLESVSTAIASLFTLLLPFLLLGYSPTFLFNVTLGANIANAVSANPLGLAPWQTTVSSLAFNIWPLVTYYFFGQHRYSRFTYPDTGTSQFLRLSLVTTGSYTLLLFLSYLLLLQLVQRQRKILMPFVAVFLSHFALYMLLTRVHDRHGVLLIPLLLASGLIVKAPRLFKILLGILTFTQSAAVYVLLVITSIGYPGTLPLFSAQNGWVNAILFGLFFSDSGITAIAVLNLLGFLAVLAYYQHESNILQLNAKLNPRLWIRPRSKITLAPHSDISSTIGN